MRAKQIIDRNFLWFVVPSCIMLVVSFFMGTLGVNLLLTPITDSPSANAVSLFAKLGGAAFLLGGMGIGFYSFLIFLMSFITKLAYKNTKGRVTAYRVLTCITCAIAIFPFCSLFEFLVEIAAVGIPYLVVTVVACIVNLKGAFSKELVDIQHEKKMYMETLDREGKKMLADPNGLLARYLDMRAAVQGHEVVNVEFRSNDNTTEHIDVYAKAFEDGQCSLCTDSPCVDVEEYYAGEDSALDTLADKLTSASFEDEGDVGLWIDRADVLSIRDQNTGELLWTLQET